MQERIDLAHPRPHTLNLKPMFSLEPQLVHNDALRSFCVSRSRGWGVGFRVLGFRGGEG